MSTVEALDIEAAASATGGRIWRRGARAEVLAGVSIDSRGVSEGQAFFAIRGERHDGHRFWQQADGAGAALLVLEQPPAGEPEASVLLVEDTTRALGALARCWRERVAPEVVGVTGSVGKTTTKELLRELLSRVGPTCANRGNFNNRYGLPLTLLGMPADTRFLIAEMGMSARGEIAYLADIARPDVGVITALAPVHLEQLGSMEQIARAKGELLDALGPAGRAVLPGDEPLLAPWQEQLGERCLRFGEGDECEVRIGRVEPRGPRGSAVTLELAGLPLTFELPLVGAYNARNAAACAAVGLLLGLAPDLIAAALETPPPLSHRSTLRELGRWKLLDDCYNASPVATSAALDALLQLAAGGPAVAVLGEMLELGERSAELHEEVGGYAARAGLPYLVTVGAAAEEIGHGAREAGMPAGAVRAAGDAAEAAAIVEQLAPPGAWILVKASRGARLERVIEELQRRENRRAERAL